MKKLIITGNGFDKAHGLQTNFNDFLDYSTMYKDKYSLFRNKNNCWRDVEDKFKELVSEKLAENGSNVDIGEIIENIVDTYGMNEHGEVNYYDYKSEAFREDIESVSQIVLLLISFEADFLHYLRTLYRDSKIRNYFKPMMRLQTHFNSATKVINFNYTNVIELLYGIPNVEHVHGNINNEIVIGCDTFQRLRETVIRAEYPSKDVIGRPKDVLVERLKYYEYDRENHLTKRTSIERFFNEVTRKTKNNEEELMKWLRMRSKDLLDTRKEIIETLSKEYYDEVCIIGHSLGHADWNVFNAIRSKKVICYYHERYKGDKSDYENKVASINENHWKMILKSDKGIYD